MSEPTHTPETSNTPGTAYGWCSWHDNFSRGLRLIQVHEQGSGPGGGVFACHSCRVAYDLVPFADRPAQS